MSGSGGMRGSSGRASAGRALFRALTAFSALSALSALSPCSVYSQTDPRLIEVIRHAQEGQGDSARIKVQRLLSATPPGDTLYPQIVYTQAMVASDAADMRRQLQRVAVEYSSSSWADDALLRLVQLDYASANLEGAARNLERIRLDYPGSPLLPQASYWAARTYFDQKKPEQACRWIAQGMVGSRGNIELQNQLAYLNQRCSNIAIGGERARADTQGGIVAVPADSQPVIVTASADTARPPAPRADTAVAPTPTAPTPTPPAPVTPEPAEPSALPSTRYRVQITAVRSVETARSMAAKLKNRGFNVVTVEEGGLYKVRIGDYPTKAEAIAAIPEIKAKLGGSPFVVTES